MCRCRRRGRVWRIRLRSRAKGVSPGGHGPLAHPGAAALSPRPPLERAHPRSWSRATRASKTSACLIVQQKEGHECAERGQVPASGHRYTVFINSVLQTWGPTKGWGVVSSPWRSATDHGSTRRGGGGGAVGFHPGAAGGWQTGVGSSEAPGQRAGGGLRSRPARKPPRR